MLFADYLKIFLQTNFNDISNYCRKIQNYLDRFSNWRYLNFSSVETAKYSHTTFFRKRNSIQYQCNINDTTFTTVIKIKDLGMALSSDLLSDNYIDFMYDK